MSIWGVDVGTSNVAATKRFSDGSFEFYFLKFDPNQDPYDIHRIICDFVSELSLHELDVVYIESVFYRFNVRTLIRLTRVAHSLNISFGDGVDKVSYVDNNTWRSKLFGTSKIKKEACQDKAYEWWPEILEYPKYKRGHLADSRCIAEYGYLRLRENMENNEEHN